MPVDVIFEELEGLSEELHLEYMWELAELPDSRSDKIKSQYTDLEQQFIHDIGDILEESSSIESLEQNTDRKLIEYWEKDFREARAFQKFTETQYAKAYNQLQIPSHEKALASMSKTEDRELFFNYIQTRLEQTETERSEKENDWIKGLVETGLHRSQEPKEFAEYLRGIRNALEVADKGLETRMNKFIEELYLTPSPVNFEALYEK